MEVSNKKITSPLVILLFISAIFIQCFPYVSPTAINDDTVKNYKTPPSRASPKIPAQPTPSQNYQTPPSRANPKIPAQPTPSQNYQTPPSRAIPKIPAQPTPSHTIPSPSIPTGPPPSRTMPANKFCIPKREATDAQLQTILDWACTNQGVDCRPTQAGGPCFNPNTVRSHAAYVMNAYYQIKGGNDFNCDFLGSGAVVYVDPSYGTCKYLPTPSRTMPSPRIPAQPTPSQNYQTPPSRASPKIPAQPIPSQNYQTPPSRASPKILPQPTPSQNYQTPPSRASPKIPAQPTPSQNYQTPPSRASPKIPAQPTPSHTMPSPNIPTGPPPSRTMPAKKFCMPKQEATDAQLQAILDWACTNQGVDCRPTQAGGPCFNPNTVRSHAAYVMNAYYQIKGKNDFNCDFRGSGAIVYVDPSYGTCKYLS